MVLVGTFIFCLCAYQCINKHLCAKEIFKVTTDQYISNLNELPDRMMHQVALDIIIPAGLAMVGNILNRNIREGKNTDGTPRTGYSTRPMYASRKQFIKGGAFKPIGKNGGKPRKTMYLPEGYKQLRDIQGRDTSKKNYEYRGDTLNAFGLEQVEDGAVIGFRTEKAAIIRKSLENRFGTAFSPSSEEIQAYMEEVIKATEKLQVKILFNIR